MSIRIMSAVWERGPADKAELLLLLALSDFANDEGECWPSIETLTKKSRLSERGVQTVLRRLSAAGWVQIDAGKGRNNTNLYRVINPAPDAPRTICPPHMTAETPHMTAINPAPAAPKPSGTIKEPSESRETPADVLCQIVRHETAMDFAAHRKAMKKPLTHEAATRLVRKLQNHPDPDAVFDLSIENGWQGVFPEKVGGRNDRASTSKQISNRSENRSDPALEQIARLAGLDQTSGNGGR